MRMNLFRSIIMSFLLIAFLFTSSNVIPGPKDTVKVGLHSAPSTLSMLELRLGSELPIILHMHQALMSIDSRNGNPIPFLAKSIRVINRKDLKIRLKKGERFHTGEPVTAHDVKFTYDQCANPLNQNLMAGRLADIEKIEVLDDYTLLFRFYEPNASWQDLMWIGICSKQYYERVGRDKFRTHPIGSGPFRFVSRSVGRSVILEAVEDYPHYKVDFKKLEFIIVPDEISRVSMLETGELDLVRSITPHLLKRLSRNKHVTIKKTSDLPSLYGISYKIVNYPIMRDKRLRMAMNYAINRQEIVDKIYLGEGFPLYMNASRIELGYNPRIKYQFNPNKARKLIKKSGYRPGTPLILSYHSAVPNASLLAQTVQKYLEDVGIRVKLQMIEVGTAATYVRKRDKRLGHMFFYTFAGGRDPNTRLLLTLLSDSPFTSYPNRQNKQKFDALIMTQSREMNRRKRLAILNKINRIWLDDPGSVILFGLNMVYAMSDRIDYTWVPKTSYLFNLGSIKIVK
jgi:peptide/nickel transport system substrate-binding protein